MPVSGPFTFIVVGDTREGAHYTLDNRFKYVADAIANESDALFIFNSGDFSRFDNESRWALFFQLADRMFANSTIFPVIGNHEYHNKTDSNLITAAVNYHSAFDMPLNYSFDCAGVRFVVLNSPDPNNANGDDPQTSSALAESQAPWLQQLLDNNMLGTFTLHHHPIWDLNRTTINTNLTSWEELYHTYNISANFAGHTHNYQRYNVSGIPYFIVGNGGGPCDPINSNDTHAIWYITGLSMQLGYLKVTVDPANNTATAWEITIGTLTGIDDDEIPQLYNSPVIGDTIKFPLKADERPAPTTCSINNEHIKIGNKHAEAHGSGSATNNINIVTSHGP
jgi:acid phosphatase type 7